MPKLPEISRRTALISTLGLGASTTLQGCAPTKHKARNDAAAAQGQFAHGIASGDPHKDSVVLWTRITPHESGPTAAGPITLIWEISEDKSFTTLSAQGEISTSKARDYTAKVLAEGLKPGTNYSFRFRAGDAVSPIGRTKTLPVGTVEHLHFAAVSCANFQRGYFNVYDAIAKADIKEPYDALLHLGDYYYEYGPMDEPVLSDRIHDPKTEIISLSDYRKRHAQYRTDPALQSVSARMPLITIWDDHETSNDSWKTGALNHQPESEGSWTARKQAALRAYYEWMPIREPRAGHLREDIYRNFEFGDLLSLICVETRLKARGETLELEKYAAQLDEAEDPQAFLDDILRRPKRDMFGQDQQDWIIKTLATSKAKGTPWRLMANQVIMGRLLTPDFTPYINEETLTKLEKDWPGGRDFVSMSKHAPPLYPDSWDGYPVARENFYAALGKQGLNDLIVITGDAHEFWANELTTTSGEKRGVELVTSSVSSNTITHYLGDNTADYSLLLTQSNEDARYYNALHRGFLDLRITPKHIKVKMIAIDTVLSLDYAAFNAAQFTIRKSGDSVKFSAPKGLNFRQRLLFHGLA